MVLEAFSALSGVSNDGLNSTELAFINNDDSYNI